MPLYMWVCCFRCAVLLADISRVDTRWPSIWVHSAEPKYATVEISSTFPMIPVMLAMSPIRRRCNSLHLKFSLVFILKWINSFFLTWSSFCCSTQLFENCDINVADFITLRFSWQPLCTSKAYHIGIGGMSPLKNCLHICLLCWHIPVWLSTKQ